MATLKTFLLLIKRSCILFSICQRGQYVYASFLIKAEHGLAEDYALIA
jgi:hypothetical protein